MRISVVIPVCNEARNVGPLAREIQPALADHRPFEIIFVDDGSTDGTAADLLAARDRVFRSCGCSGIRSRSGQSAAVHTGVRAARATGSPRWMATARTILRIFHR